MSTPYRPSNGSEGEMFKEQFCYRCKHDDYDNAVYCPILGASLVYEVDDPQYPKEWIADERGPQYLGICTAFEKRE
jgi:hypothetical protein